MPVHNVKQGESLSRIAFRYGFTWKYLWNLPENQELRDKRGDPNVLYPGDEIFYPDKRRSEEGAGTDSQHEYKKRGVPFLVRLTLLNINRQPLEGAEWYFEIDGTRTETDKTGPDGRLEQTIPPEATSVVLHACGWAIPVKLDYLDPANTVTGIQQRLANLGYDVGPVDGILGPRTRSALRDFQQDQSDHGLDATGEPDAKTIKRLRELHENIVLDGRPNELEPGHPAPAPAPAASPSEPEEPSATPDQEDDVVDGEAEEWSDAFVDEAKVGTDASRPMSVECVQQLLTDMGYDPGPIDGIQGPLTTAAVRLFQETEEIDVDGIVGPQTRTALRKAYS